MENKKSKKMIFLGTIAVVVVVVMIAVVIVLSKGKGNDTNNNDIDTEIDNNLFFEKEPSDEELNEINGRATHEIRSIKNIQILHIMFTKLNKSGIINISGKYQR